MSGLFKVRRKTLSWESEEIYTVYHVRWFKNKMYETRFLIYKDGKWVYDVADNYEPIEE